MGRRESGEALNAFERTERSGGGFWEQVSRNIFLGIDHTAIVISDTDKSLAFYRDLLGLRVAGESENYGIEQST